MSQSQLQTVLLTFRLFAEKHPAFSQAALRNLRFHQESNGFSGAFKTLGKRVYIDEPAFFRIIEEQNRQDG